jgi:hypothetical protein
MLLATGARADASDPTFRATLLRGPCLGTCPAYAVTIDARGVVTFTGHHPGRGADPPCLGRHTWTIGPHAAADLAATVDRLGFFGFGPAYRGPITDAPPYIVTITRHGRTKTVTDHAGDTVRMPPGVSEVEDAIDRAAGVERCVAH